MTGKGPQVRQIKNGTKIDKEPLGPLPGKDLGARLGEGQSVDGVRCEAGVVRNRPGTHVARRARERSRPPSRRSELGANPVHYSGNVIGLATIPSGIVQRGDLARVVEEGVRVRDRRHKPELVRDRRRPRTRVVDVDLIQHVRPELKEVRTPVRVLKRNVVRQDSNGAVPFRADKRVKIRAVSHRILRNAWSFSVR